VPWACCKKPQRRAEPAIAIALWRRYQLPCGIQTAWPPSVRECVMMTRYFAIALLGPLLSVTPAQAQDSASYASDAPAPVYCKSRGPSIFTGGGSDAKGCVQRPDQPRCKAQRASIFTGSRGTGTCVLESADAQMVVERAPIFSGRARKPRAAVAAAPAPAYSAPTYTNVVAADGTVTQQVVPTVAVQQPAAEAPKPKRRRASIFTGGARRKD
jgi:hypothetical protein